MAEPTATPIPDLMRAVEDAAEVLGTSNDRGCIVLDGSNGDLVGVERLGELARIIADASPVPETDRPYVSTLLTYSRRAARKAVSWYVEPALGHVTRFNEALLGQIRSILGRIDAVDSRLERDVATLRREIAELRAQIAEGSETKP